MKFIDEFRNKEIAQRLVQKIHAVSTHPVQLMEVCGTHTVSFFRYGIRGMLPPSLRLISGPGCPVCVTPNTDIDLAIALSRQKGVIIAIFGDMMRVPGSTSSLQKEKAEGGDIRIITSSIEALRIAGENPDKEVVFFAIGFETTSPTIAVALLQSKRQNIRNLYFLNSQKRIPSTIRTLLQSEKVRIDGFILPGHVSAIIGSEPYQFISNEFSLPAVITGFEPLDILQGVWMLVRQIEEEQARVEIQYKRAVPEKGNPVAINKIDEAFEKDGALWRGLGWIPDSGYAFKETLQDRDARNLEAEVELSKNIPGVFAARSSKELRLLWTASYLEALVVLKTPSVPAWSLWKELVPLIINTFRIWYA